MYDAASQLMHTTLFYSSPGRPDFRVAEYPLRVIFPEELKALLELAGLVLETRYGDMDRAPFRSESPSQVCIARAA